MSFYILICHGVICTVNKIVFRGLVHYDPEFAPDVVRELVLVPVEVIFRNIGQYGNVWPEHADVIELETADLHDVPFAGRFLYLPGKTIPDIAYQCTVHSRRLEDVMDQRSSGCLPVTPCYAYYPAVPLVPVCQFHLADHGNFFF